MNQDVQRALDKFKTTSVQQQLVDLSSPQASYHQPSKHGQRCLKQFTIIAITGKPRSGKDFLSQYVYNTYQRVAILPYSQLIINEVNSFLDNSIAINEGNKIIPEARNLLIAWGNYRRQQSHTYWTDILERKIFKLKPEVDLVFLPGARKQSDIDFLAGRRHQVWRVIRSQSEEIYDPQDDLAADQIIVNDKEYIKNIEAGLAKLRI